MGPRFTSGSQQNDLLEILRSHIAADPILVQQFRVEGVDITAKLMEAAATKGTDAYQTEQRFAWVRSIGDDMMKRQQAVLTMAHLGNKNKHWVGLVVDARDKAIYYGDSLDSPIPPNLLETYQWWILQHSSTSFDLKNLPITHQEDGYLCGILADNALAHFALLKLFPLFKSFEARAARMSAFVRVAYHILEQVSTHINLLNIIEY